MYGTCSKRFPVGKFVCKVRHVGKDLSKFWLLVQYKLPPVVGVAPAGTIHTSRSDSIATGTRKNS